MYFELYRDRADEWRWTLIASNGNKIACSGEGYVRKVDAAHGIDLIKSTTPATEVREVERS